MAIITTPGQDRLPVKSRSIAQVPVVSPAAGVATAAGVSVGLAGLVGLVGLVDLVVHALLTTQGLGVARPTARQFADGALSNIANPKIAVFYFALLPQFVPPQAGHPTLTIFVLGLLFVLITFAVKAPVGWFAGRLRAGCASARNFC